MVVIVPKALSHLALTILCEVGNIFIIILGMRKLRFREIKEFSYGHVARKLLSQDLSPDCLMSGSALSPDEEVDKLSLEYALPTPF